MKSLIAAFICFCLLFPESFSQKEQIRVLFIGNSQLGIYGPATGKRIWDLPAMIKDLSDSAPASHPRIIPEIKALGGASLKKFWETGDDPGSARHMIASGGWDYVVIQEIFNAGEEEFRTYASLFNEVIKKSGARTILFATSSFTEHYKSFPIPYPNGLKHLNDMQMKFGKEKGITVAAAGYAWMRYLGKNPSEEEILDLYAKDRGHPGFKGSYIYACLLYSVLTGKNPARLTSSFKNNPEIEGSMVITRKEALKMQKASWMQFKADRKRENS